VCDQVTPHPARVRDKIRQQLQVLRDLGNSWAAGATGRGRLSGRFEVRPRSCRFSLFMKQKDLSPRRSK
jgi:hypothetical protein